MFFELEEEKGGVRGEGREEGRRQDYFERRSRGARVRREVKGSKGPRKKLSLERTERRAVDVPS